MPAGDDVGRITEEGIAHLRARIGIPEPHPVPPHYFLPNEDAFRHVAEAYGDDNPLWCDPDVRRRVRLGRGDRTAGDGRAATASSARTRCRWWRRSTATS